jgi:hypothetical protein
MEHLTLEKIALLIGQLQLSVVNLESYVEKLEKQLKDLEINNKLKN